MNKIMCLIVFAVLFLVVVAFICRSDKEKFITLSALNFAAAARARQLRYYDHIYGYDPRRWLRNSMFGSSGHYYYGGIYPQFQPVGLYGYQNRFQGSRDLVTGKRIY